MLHSPTTDHFARLKLALACLVLSLLTCDEASISNPRFRMEIDEAATFEATDFGATIWRGDGLAITAEGTDADGVSRSLIIRLEPGNSEALDERRYAHEQLCSGDRLCVDMEYRQTFNSTEVYYNLTNDFPTSVEIDLTELDFEDSGQVSGSFSANLYSSAGNLIRLTDGEFVDLTITE